MHTIFRARVVSALLLAAPVLLGAQTRTAATNSASAPVPAERREDWQRAPAIFAALGATTGSRIADLGSGEGWLSFRLARHVGATGRVYASDIDPNALRKLSAIAQRDTLRNIELLLAEEDDPRLPFESLDGVVIVNAYHEMVKRVAVLDGIKRALKPGGKLVIVDNEPADTVVSRQSQVARHTLGIDYARDDLEAHGFEIVTVEPKFIDVKHSEHPRRQWMLVARWNGK